MSHWTTFSMTIPRNHSPSHVRIFLDKHLPEVTMTPHIEGDCTVWRVSSSVYLEEAIPTLNMLHRKYSINPVILNSTYFGGCSA